MQKVAPWLTVDGDPYPAVVDGRVVWIMDGYTTTDRYPNSERDSFEEMISDALTPTTMVRRRWRPTTSTTCATRSRRSSTGYDGTVTLYEWEEDPILNAWQEVFPGVVKPKEDIPEALLEPPALPRGHVQGAAAHPGAVPRHPGAGLLQGHRPVEGARGRRRRDQQAAAVPAVGAAAGAGEVVADRERGGPPTRPRAGRGAPPAPVFSLTSVYTPNNRDNLASFIAVNSDATDPEYGSIRILRLPDDSAVQGPSQIANTFAADERIQTELLPIRNNSQVRYGNLLTLPVGGGLLYVQPVYALRESGQGTYPVLRFVLASFGKEAGYGTSLTEALDDVLRNSGNAGYLGPTEPEDPSQPGQTGQGGVTDPRVLDLLRKADLAFDQAQAALRRGDLETYGRQTTRAQSLVALALQAAEPEEPEAPAGNGNGGDGGGGGGGGG